MQSEWGIPFDYIEDNWDDAQFALMAKMLAERLGGHRARESGAVRSRDWLKSKGYMADGD